MRRLLGFFLALTAVLSLAGCASKGKYEGEVQAALGEIEKAWSGAFLESYEVPHTVEVKNTRVIFIKEGAPDSFADIDYIVEFVLFTHYMGSAQYSENAGIKDCVVVYRDGSMEVAQRNPIVLYRSRTFSNDFSDMIATVEDLDDAYNQVLKV